MATQVNVREIILETLLLITRDGEYSHIALKNVLDKYQYLEKRERAFITRVVEGTLERQIEIDYIINQFFKSKSEQTETSDPHNFKKFGLPVKIYGSRTGQCGV